MLNAQLKSEWYVLRTLSRHGRIVARELTDGGFECVFPTVSRDRFYCGIVVKVEEPLFPDQVYVRTSADTVEQLRGNHRIADASPLPSEAATEINSLVYQRQLGLSLSPEAFPYLSEAGSGMTSVSGSSLTERV